jgi:hypothetical protein
MVWKILVRARAKIDRLIQRAAGIMVEIAHFHKIACFGEGVVRRDRYISHKLPVLRGPSPELHAPLAINGYNSQCRRGVELELQVVASRGWTAGRVGGA